MCGRGNKDGGRCWFWSVDKEDGYGRWRKLLLRGGKWHSQLFYLSVAEVCCVAMTLSMGISVGDVETFLAREVER